jgi:hypothetical protein
MKPRQECPPVDRRDTIRPALVVGGISLAWGLQVAVATYAVVRAIQFLVYPDPNPAAVVWSAHSGYFWRILTVSYGGAIATFVALLVVRGRTEASARALVPAIALCAAALALQAALCP